MPNKLIKTILSIIAFGLTNTYVNAADTNNMDTTPAGMEKCYGIAKAGNNDCSTGNIKCAGESKINADKSAWIFVPTGLCNRIINGKTSPPK
jgi:uncharacterized membrane protein